jgi:hypothetical protein
MAKIKIKDETEKYVKEVDDLFRRNIMAVPIKGVRTLDDLIRNMCEAVDRNPKMSPAQKEHCKDMIVLNLAPALWEHSKELKPAILSQYAKEYGKLHNWDVEYTEKISNDIRDTIRKRPDILTYKELTPVELIIAELMDKYKVDRNTIINDLENLKKVELFIETEGLGKISDKFKDLI